MCELIYRLPQAKVKFLAFQAHEQAENIYLGVAGGRAPAKSWLKSLADSYPEADIFCADKGLAYCVSSEVTPKYVYGDADSAGKELFAHAKEQGINVFSYPAEKDDTDLQLMLSKIPQGNLIITGIFGGRLDHLYSNIFSLLSIQEKQLKHIIMADDKEMLLLLRAGDKLELDFSEKYLENLEAISLLPFTEAAKVSLSGVHWPLENAQLELKRPYAISNVLEGGKIINCSCFNGKVGLYCTFK